MPSDLTENLTRHQTPYLTSYHGHTVGGVYGSHTLYPIAFLNEGRAPIAKPSAPMYWEWGTATAFEMCIMIRSMNPT